jgi:hypothetical protein
MHKLSDVEDAKALMTEAMEWSVWRWLLEKGRVRAAADRANAALAGLEKEVKAVWNDDLKKAYREIEAHAAFDSNPRAKRQLEKAREEAKDVDPEIKRSVKRVWDADDHAETVRLGAEATFDEAERRLSASMAREGAQQAMEAWGLREKAIRKAESLAKKN